MIIKERDTIDTQLAQLEALLALKGLSKKQYTLIKKEMNQLKAGYRGEKQCAFYLDQEIKNNPSRVIIHDLRIEHNGDIAQIDHLFINRALQFYVLESKKFKSGLHINEFGEFEYYSGKKRYGMKSPIHQAQRQARILENFINEQKLLPTRMGLQLKPDMHVRVLVDTDTRLTRPSLDTFDSSPVMKADTFFHDYVKEWETDKGLMHDVRIVARMVSKDTLVEIAQALIARHVPLVPAYHKKFGIDAEAETTSSESDEAVTEKPCPDCGKALVKRKAKRGKNKGQEFWGCSGFPVCRFAENIEPAVQHEQST